MWRTIPLHRRSTRTITMAHSRRSRSRPAWPTAPDGKPQAGMGVSAADYDCDGNLDIVKTNFAGDTTQPLPQSGQDALRRSDLAGRAWPKHAFSRVGSGFLDFDNDGWPDILRLQRTCLSGGAGQRLRIRLLANGKCCIGIWGTAVLQMSPRRRARAFSKGWPGRGCAFGDFDNDGDIDVLVNCVNSVPQLLRCDRTRANELAEDQSHRREIKPLRHRYKNLLPDREWPPSDGRSPERRKFYLAE